MQIYAVDEEKLAAAFHDDNDDEAQFAEFLDAAETADDDSNLPTDAAKYVVIDEDGRRRRVNALCDECALCRRVMALTWHHLVPKSTHSEFLKREPTATKRMLNLHGTWICRQCHSAIHGMYSNTELMKSYFKIEMLRADAKVQKWVSYVARRKPSRHYDRRQKNPNVVT